MLHYMMWGASTLGLVSRGRGCARAHYPGIYTRVSPILSLSSKQKKLIFTNNVIFTIVILLDFHCKVKSHLGWIFAHVRNPVNYTVVPKGDGLSAVMVRNAKLVAMIQSNLAVSNIKGYFFLGHNNVQHH